MSGNDERRREEIAISDIDNRFKFKKYVAKSRRRRAKWRRV